METLAPRCHRSRRRSALPQQTLRGRRGAGRVVAEEVSGIGGWVRDRRNRVAQMRGQRRACVGSFLRVRFMGHPDHEARLRRSNLSTKFSFIGFVRNLSYLFETSATKVRFVTRVPNNLSSAHFRYQMFSLWKKILFRHVASFKSFSQLNTSMYRLRLARQENHPSLSGIGVKSFSLKSQSSTLGLISQTT